LRSFGGVAQAVRAQDSYPPRRTWVHPPTFMISFVNNALLNALYGLYNI
jgi:hypothetical protein